MGLVCIHGLHVTPKQISEILLADTTFCFLFWWWEPALTAFMPTCGITCVSNSMELTHNPGWFKKTKIKHHEPSSRNREPLAKKEKGGVLPRPCLGVPRSWVPNNFDSSSHNSKPIAAITLIRVQHYSQGHFLTVAKSSHCFHGYSKYANPKTRQFFHQIPSDLWAKLGLTVWKISPNCKGIVWQPH